MSESTNEYIIDLDACDKALKYAITQEICRQAREGLPVRGIRRCKDCDHFREVRMSDGTNQHRCNGVMTYVIPNPMGFCAWSKPKEGAE